MTDTTMTDTMHARAAGLGATVTGSDDSEHDRREGAYWWRESRTGAASR